MKRPRAIVRGRLVLLFTMAAAAAGATVLARQWQLTHPAWRYLVGAAHRPSRTDLPPIQAVLAGSSYAYLIASQDPQTHAAQVMLIDTGSDPAGTALLSALADAHLTARDVSHILLTHGHQDHTAALGLFPQAAVHAAMADGALALGDVGPRSQAMRMVMRFGKKPRQNRPIQFLYAGQTLHVCGQKIDVVALPGHTQGSLAYHLQQGLVAGDAVFGPSLCGPQLRPYPSLLADAPDLVEPVLGRIDNRMLTFVADGHTGITCRAACAEMRLQP